MTRETLTLGEWRADRRAGILARAGESRDVEPKVMDLLFLLAERPGRVVSREEITAALWPGTTVNEDSLARCVFKLRRALDDDPRSPRFIETIPKRGYRVIARADEALLRRAEEFYFQFTRADNEAAIALYERALARDADDAPALAGLANGLVQRAVRWLGETPRATLGQALDSGVLATAEGTGLLARALVLAQRAVALRPDAVSRKALGLTLAALRRFGDARKEYEKALALDGAAWGVLINLADLDGLEGDEARALANLQLAYDVMSRAYQHQAVMIRPWHAALGVLIAERHLALGDAPAAKAWYERVLAQSPLDEKATAGLARLLAESGDEAAARELCRALVARIGKSALCAAYL